MTKKTNSNIEIHGTIRRNCDVCKKEEECNCVYINGKCKVLCRECTLDKQKRS